MDDQRRDRLKEVLLVLGSLPAAARPGWVASRLADDPELQREVESLLAMSTANDPIPITSLVAGAVELGAALPGRIGPYVPVARLGTGGMSTVYRARQEEPVARVVALKLLRHGWLTPGMLRRFDGEREVIARLSHPNVARMLDAGVTADGLPYLAMELVDGPPLTDYVRLHNLGVRERVGLLVQVCRGVQHAHGRGILHRDLKPSNVLVAETDGRPLPKVIDFGLSRLLAPDPAMPRQTLGGEILGTVEYMSPEQADPAGDAVDVRADVYALGVLLYELLTGRRPADDLELRRLPPEALRRTLLELQPTPPSAQLGRRGVAAGAAVRRVPPELDCVCLKAIEAERAMRYGSVADFADDLERFLSHRVVRARPPTRLYVAWKLVRRHRVGFALLVLGLAGALSAVTAAAVGYLRVREQRQSAELLVEQLARERDRAGAALLATREVADFLRELFLSVQPSRLGPQATLPEILREAATRLEQSPPQSAAVRARVAFALAEPLFLIGDHQRAEALLEPVLPPLRTETEAAGRELLVRVLLRLGYCAIRRSDPVVAVALLDEALAAALPLGKEVLVDQVRGALANVRLASGDDAGAADLLTQMLAAMPPGSAGLLRASVAANLGTALANLGRHEVARQRLEEAYRLRQELAPRDPATFQTAWNLALEILRTEPRAAVDMLAQSVGEAAAALGATHPDVVLARLLLGYSRTRAGDPAGLDEVETALAQLRPAGVPLAAAARPEAYRVATLHHVGRHDEAEAAMTELRRQLRAPEQGDAGLRVSIDLLLGQLLPPAGRPAMALAVLGDAFAEVSGQGGPSHLSARVARAMATAHAAGGDAVEAAAWQRDAVRLEESRRGR